MSEIQDQIILNRGDIVVSKALVRVGRDTYSVASIGSVFICPPQRRGLIIAIIVCGLLAISMFNGDAVGGGLIFAFIAFVFILAVVGLPSKLMLRTASGDHPMLQNRNAVFLNEIKAAIEQALINRS